mmetsp:Transcript_25371/g.63422  ORF Transcript_25371/g.63422 Transcript_25371/m.63422 type:complete len:146 (+) Transcript_25371:393-830(+)
MGKVDVEIFEGTFDSAYDSCEDVDQQEFCISEVDLGIMSGNIDLLDKKILRSGVGTTANTRAHENGAKIFNRGKLIANSTFNYCAAPGLIAAGVFSAPDPRPPPDSKRPASSDLSKGSNSKKKRAAGSNRSDSEDSVVDLTAGGQ